MTLRATLLAAAPLLTGCPGSLGDIQRYLDAAPEAADASTFDARPPGDVTAPPDVTTPPDVTATDVTAPPDVTVTDVVAPPDVAVDVAPPPDAAAQCPDIERELLPRRCGTDGCHSQPDPVVNLDLAAPGVAARLANVTSRCRAMPLVSPRNPDGSWLYLKVSQPRPTCGQRMPTETPLTAAEVACVRAWIAGWR